MKSKIVKPIGFGLLILIGIAVLARILYLISGIPLKIDKEFSAVQFRMDDETTVENTTITIKGKYYKQWFSSPKFEGSFIIDNYDSTKYSNTSYISFIDKDDRRSIGYLNNFIFSEGTFQPTLNGVFRMTDNFVNISINLFEPIYGDSKTVKDLWIVAPASSREEALILLKDLQD